MSYFTTLLSKNINSETLDSMRPPNSSDMRVIEDLLSVVKMEVNKIPRHWSFKSKVQCVVKDKVESEFMTKLMNSMPKRLRG